MEREEHHCKLTLGAAAAAILSACFGIFVMAIAAIIAAASPDAAESLSWWEPTGPLSGVSTVGLLAWLGSWALLHPLYKNRKGTMVISTIVALAMLLIAFILFLPPVTHSFRA